MGEKQVTPTLLQKLVAAMQSRKFWALIVAIGFALFAYLHGDVTAIEGLQTSVYSLVAYMLSVAFEDGMARMGKL